MNRSAVPPSSLHRRRALVAGAALLLVLALLGAAVPAATREAPQPAPGLSVRGPVHTIALPDDPPVIPDGPNRAQFQALCRLCHSPRLVLTQPRFPEKKWGEVVHKMVAVYGAPIAPEQEQEIVAYLAAVHGTAP